LLFLFTFTLFFPQQDSSGNTTKLNLKKKTHLLYTHFAKLNPRTRNATSVHAQSATSNLAKKAMKQSIIMQWKEIT